MIHPGLQSTMGMLLDWKSVSSLFGTVMLLISIHNYIPLEVRLFARKLFNRLFARLKPTSSVVIDEVDSITGTNELFDSAQLYLGNRCLTRSSSVRLFKQRNTVSTAVIPSLPDSHTVLDIFQAVPMKWKSHKVERSAVGAGRGHHLFNHHVPVECRSLELHFHPRHRDLVHNVYIPHVIEEATKLRHMSRGRRLYTNRPSFPGDDSHRLWSSNTFLHPSNFETLALDPVLQEDIRNDLLRFLSRQDHYTRVGRAWKRGYLLYGPPGTGKTSLVAAIANLLQFDVYDLELTTVPTNNHLRRLLVSTTPKSVVVVEDIDCSLDLTNRKKMPQEEDSEITARLSRLPRETISLSGVLNFIDGLWSSCVGERLMIFTTNHPERLDPALLRPGRMDRKIELGYCGKAALRTLVRNYLGIEQEEMDGKQVVAEIESLIEEVKVTPAEVAEVFMGCDGDSVDAALQKLLDELHQKKLKQLQKETSEENGSVV